MAWLAWPLVTSINNTSAIPTTPKPSCDVKSMDRRRKQKSREPRQTNLAECCSEWIPFSYTLLPCPSRAGLCTKRSPLSKGSWSIPVQELLPLEIILVPWVGSGDPYTFSDLCTIDEGLKMIPPMSPMPLGIREVWKAMHAWRATDKSSIQLVL